MILTNLIFFFASFSKLEMVYIFKNSLVSIGSQLLDSVDNLKLVRYGRNVCMKQDAKTSDKSVFKRDVEGKCSV